MTDHQDLEAMLRATLSERADRSPAAGPVMDRIIAEAGQGLRPATGSPRGPIWRTWTLPLVAAASVVGVLVAVLVAVNSGHHTINSAVTQTVPQPSYTGHPTPGASGNSAVPASFEPVSATFVSADDGWVLGRGPCSNGSYGCAVLARTTDGGRSWAGIPAPSVSVSSSAWEIPSSASSSSTSRSDVWGVRFADANNGWIYGYGLWATHDGGAHWTRIAAMSPPNLLGQPIYGLVTADYSVWVEIRDYCNTFTKSPCPNNPFSVFHATTTSDTWTQVGPYTMDADQLAHPQLFAYGPNWWLTTPTALYHGVGGGAATRVPVSCPAGLSLVAATAADSQHLDALCEGGPAAGSARYQLLGTINGGASWVLAGPELMGATNVAGIADNAHGVLIVATSSGASQIMRTTNDGGSFSSVLGVASGGVPWSDLGFTDGVQGFAILGAHSFYLTRDAGATWQLINFG